MRVALIGHNSIEYIEKLLEIWNNNDSAVLLDYDIPESAVRQMLEQAEVDCCIIEDSLFSSSKGLWSSKVINYSVTLKMPCILPKSILEKYIARYDESEAVVIYSSGTTGKSKGVSLSHRAINNNADSIIDYMQPAKDDCLYLNKKLSHCSSLIGELLVALKSGADILLAPLVVPPRVVFRNIENFNITILECTPNLLNMYSEEAFRTGKFPKSVKKVYTCGDSISLKDIERARNLFGCPVFNVYGQTECGPRISAQTMNCCNGNSVGKPIKNVEVKINCDGEILVNTNALFSAYTDYGVEQCGWHKTGDIGYFAENGELYVVGRSDNMLIIDAHNVYPEVIEKVIIDNTDVMDCLVFKDRGKLICDYCAETDIESIQVQKTLKEFLMPYEIPKIYKKVDSIPRNRNGKKLRKNMEAF